MQSSAWVALLRHIPVEQQNRFMLVTASGTEITIASFLRIEQDFAVFKGRLSGTQDQGRIFFIPYANIDYFGFQQQTKDSEFNELFDGLVLPDETPRPAVAATNGHINVASAAAPEEPVIAPAPPTKPGSGSRPAIRSEVLERFRSRPATPTSSANLPNPRQEP